MLTGATLLGTCGFIAGLVGILHWREKVTDALYTNVAFCLDDHGHIELISILHPKSIFVSIG